MRLYTPCDSKGETAGLWQVFTDAQINNLPTRALKRIVLCGCPTTKTKYSRFHYQTKISLPIEKKIFAQLCQVETMNVESTYHCS